MKKKRRGQMDDKSIQNVLRLFNGKQISSDEEESNGDSDEIKQYIRATISYPESMPILSWWKNHAFAYPT